MKNGQRTRGACDAYDPGRHFRCTLESGHAGQHAMALDPIPKQKPFWTRRELYNFLNDRMCLCGSPESVLAMLVRLLRWIDEPLDTKEPGWNERYAAHRASLEAWCPDTGVSDFLFYWLDHEDLTEHGGSVPGWLTKKGEGLLGALAREENDWRAFVKLHLCGHCGGDGCSKCTEGLQDNP